MGRPWSHGGERIARRAVRREKSVAGEQRLQGERAEPPSAALKKLSAREWHWLRNVDELAAVEEDVCQVGERLVLSAIRLPGPDERHRVAQAIRAGRARH